MKRKICILQNGLAFGGTDTFVLNLCRGLDKSKFDITVVNPSNKPGSRVLEPEIMATGAHIVHTYPLSGIKGQIKHLLLLYKLLRKERFDVFHTNIDLFNGPNLFIAWLAHVPVRCCHSHNAQQQLEIIKGKTIPIKCYQLLMRWLCWNFSNRKTGCSPKAMDFLFSGKNWRDAEYPTIIYNGIDISKYRNPIDVKQKKQQLGLTNRLHILTVGRIIPQKNPLFLSKVLCEVFKFRSDCDMIWIGTGSLEMECRDIFIKQSLLDRVHFLGQRNDVNEILQCADVFYMPSVFEGLPFVLVEAQAAGLQCVVSDTIDTTVNCGGCHFLPLSLSEQKWAQIIIDTLDKKICHNIDENKLYEFSVDHLADQMQKVFES